MASQEFSEANMVNTTDFYCSDYCCYLGPNNNDAQRNITSFQNFGLPLNENLQVFHDRGCGDLGGSYNEGVVTNDMLSLSTGNAYTYSGNPNGSNIYSSKTTTFSSDGVVVCQSL